MVHSMSVRSEKPSGLGRSLPWVAAALLVLPVVGGCRAGRIPPPDAVGTSVQAGENLHGRVHCQNGDTQCFTFEGVESSLLAFRLVSDDGSVSAPLPVMTDPEGKPVDVSPYVTSPFGAATMQAKGIPLRRTGIYRVTVQNAVPGMPIFYRFQYDLDFPPIQGLALTLRPGEPSPIYVAAPRGGQVIVRVLPRQAGTYPELQGVVDPWGGRALDATQTPTGKPIPQAARGDDGSLYLSFVAPRPGVYTVLAAARCGCGGDATVSAEVKPGCSPANVWHTDAPCSGYGMPGQPVSSAGTLPMPTMVAAAPR